MLNKLISHCSLIFCLNSIFRCHLFSYFHFSASLDKTKSDIKKQARPSLEEEFLEDLKEKYLHKK